MAIYLRALTWDDPRGRGPAEPLAAAFAKTAAGHGVEIEWVVQPLGGFESASLVDHAEQYDLLIIDHPHVIEAATAGAIEPLELTGGDCYIGPSLASYRWQGKLWAVPVDAASHVAADRENRGDLPPVTWDSFFEQARSGIRFALPLQGVHALMATLTLLASLGTALDSDAAEQEPAAGLPSDTSLAIALEFLSEINAACLPESLNWNPIQALEALSEGACDCLPLTFGYAHFQHRGVRFAGIPVADSDRLPRPILGGTGMAVSARRPNIATAVEVAKFAGSREVQCGLWPQHGGQPAHRDAWLQLAETDRFYRDTAATMPSAYVRPRCLGWNQFQTRAGSAINHWLASGSADPYFMVDQVKKIWREATNAAGPSNTETSIGNKHVIA